MNWGLLGHEWAVELLAGHLRRGEARHAYLLCGPAGIGRRTLALRFAQALNCPQPSPSGQACMRAECRSCRQWMVMQHPDLSLLQPANLGDTIKVDELRGTLAPLSLTPYEAPHRVALLLDFESATDGAQNALLKTLEEAPPSVVLLLTADAPESLLPTVVSRCEVLRLRPVSTERLESWLTERGVDTGRARLLAHFCGGRPGAALKLAEDEDALERRQIYLQDAMQLLMEPLRERFAYAEKLTSGRGRKRAESRETLREALQVWLSLWRDVLHQAAGSQLPPANPDVEADIARLSAGLGYQRALRLVKQTDQALTRLSTPLNLRLQTETLLMDWPRIN